MSSKRNYELHWGNKNLLIVRIPLKVSLNSEVESPAPDRNVHGVCRWIIRSVMHESGIIWNLEVTNEFGCSFRVAAITIWSFAVRYMHSSWGHETTSKSFQSVGSRQRLQEQQEIHYVVFTKINRNRVDKMPYRKPREIHYELAPRTPRRPVSIYRIIFALIVGICILAAILYALYIVW